MSETMNILVYILVAVISFVVAVIGFVVMIVNDLRHHKQDAYRFDSLDKEHGRLTKDHDKLSDGQDRILEKQDILRDRIFEFIGKEEGRREQIGSILPQQDVITQIQKLYDKILTLHNENVKLRCQIQQLQKELALSQNREKENGQNFEDFDIEDFGQKEEGYGDEPEYL